MILDQVSNNLFSYLKENNQNRLLLGISGGVDSVVLLDILHKIKKKYLLEISLIHINYGMQKKSDNAESLCYNLASSYKIDIISKKVNCPNCRKQIIASQKPSSPQNINK